MYSNQIFWRYVPLIDRNAGDRVTATNSCFTQLVSVFEKKQITKHLPYPLIELQVKRRGGLMRTDIFRWDEREVS